MSYSIIRVAKVKSGTNTTGIQKHVQRENINYENEDIDHSKSYLNYDLVNDTKKNFNDLIDEKIEQNYKGKRKIRKDAVKHVDGLITSDDNFFDNKTPEETYAFFEHAKTFLEQEYGKDNLLYATVHMDERTPHMHYGVVPITDDGRMSAKEVVGNKKALTEFQDRFNEYVNNRGYDLERGQSRQVTGKKHEQVNRYKQKTEYHKQEYERESQKLSHIKQENEKLEHEYQKSLDTLKKPLNVQYEYETKEEGGLFNKQEVKTGNVVLTQEDFDDLLRQSKSANHILNHYEDLNNGTEIVNLRKDVKDMEESIDNLIEMGKKGDENERKLYKENQSLKDENQKQSEVITKFKDTFHNTMNVFEKLLGKDRFKDSVLKIDNMLNNNQLFRNLVVGFDDKYETVFTRNDKLNLVKEKDYVSQNISINDMDKQTLGAELETSDSLLTLEFDLDDKEFDDFLIDPDKYIVVAPMSMEDKPFLLSLDDIKLDKPLEFDKDLGLGESHELDMDFDLDLER
ncbi:MobV family relaxase [Streptococcus pseudopneumoniae]|uniref:MobV family relaxase n=1 Tax=Streptococcus pseudopneumoniae TaxID=257758 RepID=UPI0007DBEFB1